MANSRRLMFLRIMNPVNSAAGYHKFDGIVPKMAIIFVTLLISLWFSNQTSVKLNSEIRELEQTRDMEKIRSKKLEINMISMISGEKLTEAAIKRYGFKQPSSGQVVVVQREHSFLGAKF